MTNNINIFTEQWTGGQKRGVVVDRERKTTYRSARQRLLEENNYWEERNPWARRKISRTKRKKLIKIQGHGNVGNYDPIKGGTLSMVNYIWAYLRIKIILTRVPWSRILPCLICYVCLYLHMCVTLDLCICVCGGPRKVLGIFLHQSPSYSFETRSLVKPELTLFLFLFPARLAASKSQ